jgi:hypothetical protein
MVKATRKYKPRGPSLRKVIQMELDWRLREIERLKGEIAGLETAIAILRENSDKSE